MLETTTVQRRASCFSRSRCCSFWARSRSRRLNGNSRFSAMLWGGKYRIVARQACGRPGADRLDSYATLGKRICDDLFVVSVCAKKPVHDKRRRKAGSPPPRKPRAPSKITPLVLVSVARQGYSCALQQYQA